MAFALDALKTAVGAGLLSFPVTHFTADLVFDPDPYREHVGFLVDHGPSALFAAGGTGEFFSLAPEEYQAIIATAVDGARGRLPVIAGVGYGTALAIDFARRAEKAGADGLLLLPPYLVQAEQEGLYRHAAAVCRSVGIGVILYHRDNSLYDPDTIRRLADDCPTLIGFKDGHGNIEHLVAIRETLGDRLAYVGGMPTAEVFASANQAIGISTYSSAIFNFLPDFALRFHRAIRSGDRAAVSAALRDFFLPYLSIRNRRRGYAVSIVKAGMRIIGRPAGPVRPPLLDLTPQEDASLADLIETARRTGA